jgi:hypothetical protein
MEQTYGKFMCLYILSIEHLKESHWDHIINDTQDTLSQLSQLATGTIQATLEEAVFDYHVRIALSCTDSEDDNEDEEDGESPDPNASFGRWCDPQSDRGMPCGIEAKMRCDHDIKLELEPYDEDEDEDEDNNTTEDL